MQVNKQKEKITQKISNKKKSSASKPVSPSATSVLRKVRVFISSWSHLLRNFIFTSAACVSSSLWRTFTFDLTQNSWLLFFSTKQSCLIFLSHKRSLISGGKTSVDRLKIKPAREQYLLRVSQNDIIKTHETSGKMGYVEFHSWSAYELPLLCCVNQFVDMYIFK